MSQAAPRDFVPHDIDRRLPIRQRQRLKSQKTLNVFNTRSFIGWNAGQLPISRKTGVRPVKLLKMIVWRGGTRSDRASHRT
jgi:hypothetical protein